MNGRHPTHLIVSAHNFTQCLSKLASKSIESTFRHAGVNFECHTLKNLLSLKKQSKIDDFQQDDCTIVSLDIKDMYQHCRFKAAKAMVQYYASQLDPLQQEKIWQCLNILKFSMGNTIVSFLDKYYEYGVNPDPKRQGLMIGGFKSAFLADLEASNIFDKLKQI